MYGAASGNIALGGMAGKSIYTGSSNVVIGSSVASTTLTTGSNNILIGTDSTVDTPAAGTNNFLNIGNLIYGTSIGTAASPGNVGIGTAAPFYLLHVGSASTSGTMMELQNSSGACTFTPATSNLTIACSSDQRLKTDIRDTGDALAWLDDMRVRDFTVIATGESNTGVIAQEILQTHPDLVHMGPDGYYGVDVPNIWKLVRAIQQLRAQNDELKADNEALKAANDNEADEIRDLGERLDRLEASSGSQGDNFPRGNLRTR